MRKESVITITEGRDKGKAFRCSEMPVTKLEKWAARVLIALVGGEGQLPHNIAELARTSAGAAVAALLGQGLRGLSAAAVEPLLDDLVPYIARVPKPEQPDKVIPLSVETLDAHIEDLGTLLRLKFEVVSLCLGFSMDGAGWDSLLASVVPQRDSGDTPTSPQS